MLRFSLCVSVILVLANFGHADWRGFRGDGTGISKARNLPITWTEDNILWKTNLPGPGAASPIVVGDRVFVTGYMGYGVKLTKGFTGGVFGKKKKVAPGKQEDLRLFIGSLDRKTGKKLWAKIIKPTLPEAPFASYLREHGYASSTPVSDGKNVYVFFGKTGAFAFDLDGNQLWKTSVGEGTHKWGSATSPVLAGDVLVVNASAESESVVGLDKKTGKELWRQSLPICWASPVVVNFKGGKQEIVINGPKKIVGLDPKTGKELWFTKGLGGKGTSGATCATPAVQGTTVYCTYASPFLPNATVAVRAGGKGDVTKTNVLWKARVGSGITSPVVLGDYLYWVDSIAYCLSVKDGKKLSNTRVHDDRGEYPSAIVANGKIYAQTRFNGVFVLEAGKKLKILAKNTFPGDTSHFNATPAVSDGLIFIRSGRAVYCIGKKK
ncbi:MAG: PQQ-binding-like beta-propeller repeat protein [Gemmataceae bacterium]